MSIKKYKERNKKDLYKLSFGFNDTDVLVLDELTQIKIYISKINDRKDKFKDSLSLLSDIRIDKANYPQLKINQLFYETSIYHNWNPYLVEGYKNLLNSFMKTCVTVEKDGYTKLQSISKRTNNGPYMVYNDTFLTNKDEIFNLFKSLWGTITKL